MIVSRINVWGYRVPGFVFGDMIFLWYRWRDPTRLVFGRSRSFSPCMEKPVYVRLHSLDIAEGCRRSCQDQVLPIILLVRR